ncbi:GSCOCT00005621001.3-RA-CDS [Cotesia congregata]|uniref:Odorant binding protein 33.5621 n=1 Tax=Cotesia congregata TaxID=51543 RepID=A0A8J2MP60_COTCN|nr:GSCOCT00005621001.3-RA-CDS [Cotesia congregata]CAG5099681.1 Odorant binding protein 33.5621 [Cotesia congregata]
MKTTCLIIFMLFLTLYQTQALRCRSGNQKLSDDIRKVMQKCKRRSNSNKSDDSNDSSSDHSDGDSSSDSDIFDEDFFNSRRDDSYSKTRMIRSRHQEYKQEEVRPYYMKNHTHKQDRMSDDNYYSSNNNNNNNNNHNKNRDKDSRDGFSDKNKNQDEQSCVTQCFFDELKLTNRQGFPDRTSVINMMLQGIHDPMIRDFIEQSIINCFHFVYGLHLDKCTFSHNLLSCFADKARERCEDWDD